MKKALKTALMITGVVGIAVATYKIYKEITGDVDFIDDFDTGDDDFWDDEDEMFEDEDDLWEDD